MYYIKREFVAVIKKLKALTNKLNYLLRRPTPAIHAVINTYRFVGEGRVFFKGN